MHIQLGLQWYADKHREKPVDQRLFALLKDIERSGSISAAAENTGVSYRFAWGLIREWERQFGNPLIHTERGKKIGARLTEFSQALLLENAEILRQLLPALTDHASRVSNSLNNIGKTTARDCLKIFASHDLAMSQLMETLNGVTAWTIIHEVRGSLNNLRSLVDHNCDVAGFHFPLDFPDADLLRQYQRLLSLAGASCIDIAIRRQGLIVQKGNPKNINSIRDLGKRSVRFINRQQQSGTRVLVDSLLKHAGMKPAQVNGYVNEEYTHLAVAAMVASGAADAGMGLEAAARQFKLAFVPVIKERYCLALAPGLDSRMVNMLKKHLTAARFRNRIGKIPGYQAGQCGEEVPLSRLFA